VLLHAPLKAMAQRCLLHTGAHALNSIAGWLCAAFLRGVQRRLARMARRS